eukprot:gene6969-9528_t
MSDDSNVSAPIAVDNSGYWGWLSVAQNQAKEFAQKAQELAESATKIASEKASEISKQATELRQNYDVELATSILMSTIGGPNELNTKANTAVNNKKSNSNLRSNMNELDLDYITENVISMAFPYDPTTSTADQIGNDINVVAAYFKKKHAGHFMIWNISEESYDSSKFADQVLEYKFPGHPAPPLGLLFKICTSVESWLDADETNVAVIHCLTGKGRTATLIACILTWIGEFNSPMEALQYISDRKSLSVDYLTIPSQRRYIQYFSNMLDGVKPRSEPLLLRRVIINTIPEFGLGGENGDSKGCCPYIQLFKNGKLIATAAPTDETSPDQKSKLQLKWVDSSEGSVSFTVDCAVQGDILLRCRHAAASGARISMFRAGFHTGYVPSGVLRLTKAQLDGSSSDPRYHDDFFIDLIFAPVTKSNSSNIETSESTGVLNDSGLVLDAMSTDKYEMTLHKDSRFWESITNRKLRSKRRRSRKFILNQQEQFSISDDIKLLNDDNSMEINFLGGLSNSEKSSRSTSRILTSSNTKVAGMSDIELIMQLAKAEVDTNNNVLKQNSVTPSDGSSISDQGIDSDDFTLIGKKSSSLTKTSAPTIIDKSDFITSTQSTPLKAQSELQALADLEKELGLDDLNLFGPPTNSSSFLKSNTINPPSENKTISTATNSLVGTAKVVDEDNLDELEQYLESLSAPSSTTKSKH